MAKYVGAGLAAASDYIFFVGCSEWPAGELQRQIELGGWLTAACSAPTILELIQGDEKVRCGFTLTRSCGRSNSLGP